jgi:hypothetical protein
MLDMRAHPMVEKAEKAVQTQEVQEILQRLSELGLGVFMPHIHNREGFSPLPDNIVQLEADLKVTFVNREDPKVQEAAPVGWVWDQTSGRVAAACYCTGAEHDPHWKR